MIEAVIFTAEKFKFPFNGITKAKVLSLLKKTLKALKLDNVSVTLIAGDNSYIHSINKKYRNKDYATDVISFAYRDNPFPTTIPEGQMEVLGDVYLSMERALEQSIEIGHSLEDEIARLIVHAVLHLIGFDHEKSKEDEIEMQKKEDEILNII